MRAFGFWGLYVLAHVRACMHYAGIHVYMLVRCTCTCVVVRTYVCWNVHVCMHCACVCVYAVIHVRKLLCRGYVCVGLGECVFIEQSVTEETAAPSWST